MVLATDRPQPSMALDDPGRLSASLRRCRYRAFGARTDISGIAPARQDPSFQNRTYDSGLGIYDYRNRSFDPATGRFLQRDPALGGDKLFNPYCFPGNNPVKRTDPLGHGGEEEEDPDRKSRTLEEALQEAAAAANTPFGGDVQPSDIGYTTIRFTPWTNKAVMFWQTRKPVGIKTMSGGMLQKNYPGGFMVIEVEDPKERVSQKTEAVVLGGTKAVGTAAAAIGVTTVVVYALPESIVASTGFVIGSRIVLIVGLADGSGRIVKSVPVMVDPDATPDQLEEAVNDAVTGLTELYAVRALQGKLNVNPRGWKPGRGPQAPERVFTKVMDFMEIKGSGRLWGMTEGTPYGMTTPEAPRWRTWGRVGTPRDPGTLIFEGNAAKAFSPHPIEGPFSGAKCLLGQQKGPFGDLVFDPRTTTSPADRILRIRDVTWGPHEGQSAGRGMVRLWGRRLFDLGGNVGMGLAIQQELQRLKAEKAASTGEEK